MEIVFCLSFIAVIFLWLILVGIFASTVRAYWRISQDFKQAFFFDEKVKGLTANQIARAKDECYKDVLLYGWCLALGSIAIASISFLIWIL